MNTEVFRIGEIPAVLYGDPCKQVFLFLHGQFGRKEEAADFAAAACPKGWQVLAVDLPGHGERQGDSTGFVPWQVVPELQQVLAYLTPRWERIGLRATSIGAWFSMLAFSGIRFEKALFVSPVLDMDRLICGMMHEAKVTETALREAGEIPTESGEVLSYRYLIYAKENRITNWPTPTAILYPGQDNLTSRPTAEGFAAGFGSALTVYEEGEHWFHTPEQLEVLRRWTEANL